MASINRQLTVVSFVVIGLVLGLAYVAIGLHNADNAITALRLQVSANQGVQATSTATVNGRLSLLRKQLGTLETTGRVSRACPVTGAGHYVSCVRGPDSAGPNVGQQITSGSHNPGTPWQVTDYTGAPMAWVNLFGLYSGGDGGLEPGGLICVTYGITTVACLTPEGDLTLTPTGPHGPTGPMQVFSPADIAWLHAHGG